jgi:malate synthase
VQEDAATAEISRALAWQWLHHGVQLDDGQRVTVALVRRVIDEELQKWRERVGESRCGTGLGFVMIWMLTFFAN